jgi:hypothetical protein
MALLEKYLRYHFLQHSLSKKIKLNFFANIFEIFNNKPIFLFLLLSCMLMFFYGLLITNTKIMIVNAVGFNLEALYIIFYLFYTQNKACSLNYYKSNLHEIFICLIHSIHLFRRKHFTKYCSFQLFL